MENLIGQGMFLEISELAKIFGKSRQGVLKTVKTKKIENTKAKFKGKAKFQYLINVDDLVKKTQWDIRRSA